MCLAVPMKLVEMLDGVTGYVDFDGVRCKANLSLVDEPKIGEYFLVHAGFAIERLDEEIANESIALFREIAEEMAPLKAS